MEYAALATGARRGTARAAPKARDGMVNSFIDYGKRATLVECKVVSGASTEQKEIRESPKGSIARRRRLVSHRDSRLGRAHRIPTKRYMKISEDHE